MFSDRLTAARSRALADQETKDDVKAAARRRAIVRGEPDPDAPPPPPPTPSWFQQHNPFDVGALKSDLTSLGSKVAHPLDTLSDANEGVKSFLRDSYAADAARAKEQSDRNARAIEGIKAGANYLGNTKLGGIERGARHTVVGATEAGLGLLTEVGDTAKATVPHLWNALKPGATYQERQAAKDIITAGGEGMDEGVRSLAHAPWRAVDPGFESASKTKDPWERAGAYGATAAMALLPTKFGKARMGMGAAAVSDAAGATVSGVANVGGRVIETASDAGRKGFNATLDAVGNFKDRVNRGPVKLTGQTSPRFPRALPPFGGTTPGGEPFVGHPDIGVGHPDNPVLGVVEQQDGRSRFSIRGQRPAPQPPPPTVIDSPYTRNLLPAAGEGSPSRRFPERVLTSHPDLGIALPEEPPLGVVEKFAPKPVSAGMGRTPAAQMNPATQAFEALVPERYKGAKTPTNVTVNRLGDVSAPPRKGLRTLTPTGLKNPTTTTSLAEMVDMYGLEEAAQRAQMTPKEVTEYLASRPAAPAGIGPVAPSAPKLGPVAEAAAPVVEVPPVKKARASRARPVAAAPPVEAPPKVAAPKTAGAAKSRPFEKSPTATLESLAKRGNQHALAELEFRKANPHLQATTKTTGEQGAIGTNIDKPWGEIDTTDYSLEDRRKAIGDAINRAYEQDTTGMSPQARERIAREIRSLEMIQNVISDDATRRSYSPWAGEPKTRFLYGEDPKAPGGISSAISGRMTTKEGQPALKIPFLGSIIPGEGRRLIKGLQKWGLGQGAKEVVGSPLTDARPVYESMGARPESPGAHGYEGSFGNIAGLSDEQIYKPYPSEMPKDVAKRMEKITKPKPVKTEAELANEAAIEDAIRGAEEARRDAGRRRYQSSLNEDFSNSDVRAAEDATSRSSGGTREGYAAPDEDFQAWVDSLDHRTRRMYDHSNVPQDVMAAVEREPDVVGDPAYRRHMIGQFEAMEREGRLDPLDRRSLDDWRTIERHETTSAAQASNAMDPELESYLDRLGVSVENVRASPFSRRSWENQWQRNRPALEERLRAAEEFRAGRGSSQRAQAAPPENLPPGMTPDNAPSRRALASEAEAPRPREARPTDAELRTIEAEQAESARLGPVEGSDEWWADNERGAVRLPSKAQLKQWGKKGKEGVKTLGDVANQLRIASMLSGWALPKSVLGNVGSHGVAVAENLAAGKSLKASLSPAKELFNLKANVGEFKKGWKSGANPAIAGAANFGKYNPITRTMGAADHMATESLIRSGLTKAEAKRLLLTDPQWGLKGKTSPVLDYLVPFRRTPFNVLQGGAKTMGDHPLMSLGAGAAGAGVGMSSDDPRVLALTAALLGPYTLPFLVGAGTTAGTRALQGLSPIPEWSLQKSLGDPLHPFSAPSFMTMFNEGGQQKQSEREKRANRAAKPRGRTVPSRR